MRSVSADHTVAVALRRRKCRRRIPHHRTGLASARHGTVTANADLRDGTDTGWPAYRSTAAAA